MKRWVALLSVVAASSAFAGDVEINVELGGWRYRPTRQIGRVWTPYGMRAYPYWGWVPVVQTPPPAPPPPQIIYIEREPAPVVEAPPPPPPPPPQVVVVHVAPEPTPAPAPAPAVAVVPVTPPGPKVPGPDVFSWTDDDGVVHYSTRVPADAKKRAKKVASPSK